MKPGPSGLSDEHLSRVYAFLDDAVATGKIPGAAIGIMQRGQMLPPRAFGRMIPGDPNSLHIQPETIFLVASVTKPVTATTLMLLVERGHLLLNDPVTSIIPEFGNRGKEAILVRHLLTHTSGLPDMLPENNALRAQKAPLAEFVRRICDLALDFPPGTNIQYQSTGIAILGEIVERISGVSLSEFMRREIFTPLGMVDTSLGQGHLPAERIAHVNVNLAGEGAYRIWNEAYWRNFGAPWGGMFTTVRDELRFLQMFLNGGELDGVRVLSRATVEAMTRDQTSGMVSLPAHVRQEQAWGLSWGLGWRRQPADGWSYFGDLITPGSFGHGGATGTVVWADPVREVACAIFTTQPSAVSEGFLGKCSNLVAAAVL